MFLVSGRIMPEASHLQSISPSIYIFNCQISIPVNAYSEELNKKEYF